jgi:hypothetical protein
MSSRLLVLSLVFAFAAPAAALGEEVRIIGDSIGEGLHLASGYPSPANRFNVAIYTPKIFEQIREMPRGANVVMSLGTNDAVAGMVDAKARVAQIVAAAQDQGVKLTWLGPPCVLKVWEAHSQKLDQVIAAALEGTPVAYVSAQGPEVCATALHEPDGVHFTMAGYRLLWQKAATVAGIPVVVAAASERPTVVHDGKKRTPARRHGKKPPHAPKRATPKTPAPS